MGRWKQYFKYYNFLLNLYDICKKKYVFFFPGFFLAQYIFAHNYYDLFFVPAKQIAFRKYALKSW